FEISGSEPTLREGSAAGVWRRRAVISALRRHALHHSRPGSVARGRATRTAGPRASPGRGTQSAEGASKSAFPLQQPAFDQRLDQQRPGTSARDVYRARRLSPPHPGAGRKERDLARRGIVSDSLVSRRGEDSFWRTPGYAG